MVQRSVATRGHSVKLPEGITAEKLGRDVFNKTYYLKGEDADASLQAMGGHAAGFASSPQHRVRRRSGNTGCYTPAFNMGVNVIVVNADKIVVTGNKALQKKYYTLGVR